MMTKKTSQKPGNFIQNFNGDDTTIREFTIVCPSYSLGLKSSVKGDTLVSMKKLALKTLNELRRDKQ